MLGDELGSFGGSVALGGGVLCWSVDESRDFVPCGEGEESEISAQLPRLPDGDSSSTCRDLGRKIFLGLVEV